MWAWCWQLSLLAVAGVVAPGGAEVLTPPYFNIAEGRFVEATSTCGENVEEPELYCKLTGTNQDSIHPENLIIQGQVCDWCNQSNPAQIHPAKYAVDGSENFWMSPPLSRGTDYNQVNYTISLGQEFHVSYVLIKMGNSPRPGVWVLERSSDNGLTYKPWQYFADTDVDCELFFGKDSLQPITADDSVTCETSFSKIVPLQGGEIVVSLINHRPSANDFFNSPVLQEFTRATNVRLRFLRTKTLYGHLMSIAREDHSVTRRYFYSIKDISIGGRCRCNGHADVCDETHPTNPYKLLCRCKHNTTGDNCERCKDNMVQKAWRQSKPNKLFVCEACNCHGHSNKCTYNKTIDELKLSLDIHGEYDGGGKCEDCLDNTDGINCEKCKPGFYRPFGKEQTDIDACQPCPCNDIFYNGKCEEGTGRCECNEKFEPPDCDKCSYGYYGFPDCVPCVCFLNGTTGGGYCEPVQGTCPCKSNFAGFDCRQCKEGFYMFPECKACNCNDIGSLNDNCDIENGKCECNSNYGGDKCDECANGYFDFPQCGYCSCDFRGTTEEICDKNDGQCFCKEGYGGARCDQCLPGYYGFPDCKPCNCSDIGSTSKACDMTGKCPCLSNYAGQRCERCVPGYFNYPQCNPCNCDLYGSDGISCDDSGKCTCLQLFSGPKCDKCEEGRFNFPICEECSCHPAGIVENFPGCGNLSTIGQLCQCKPRVQGRTCDQCRPLYWNLDMTNPHGCQECDCYEPGVMGALTECDTSSGQCFCKPFTTSRRCDTCVDGMFQLRSNNLFGCTECGCDLGGSESRACDKETGQCRCRSRITGRRCSEPHKAHYFPTLHQFQYEAENGTTPDRKSVRFGSSESIFPGFSWKGYVVFSKIQDELVHEVEVPTQTIYRMILRYINPNDDNVKVDVTVKSSESDEIQNFEVILKPSNGIPTFITLPSKGGIPAPLVMDHPGQWNIHIKNNRPLFLDYFVLMPAAYYEGNILIDRIVTPCQMYDKNLCRDFQYPSFSDFDQAPAKLSYTFEQGSREPPMEFFQDEEHLNKLKLDQVPMLSVVQPELNLEMKVKQPGKYVLVISYITEAGKDEEALDVKIGTKTSEGTEDEGKAVLPACPYTWVCRQVILDNEGRVANFDFDSHLISLLMQVNNNAPSGIESVTAVPTEDWSMDYIMPRPICIMKEGTCLETKYFTPLDFKKIEFEKDSDVKQSAITPSAAFDRSVGLVFLDDEESEVNLKVKVPQPGEYVIVIHYYQPYFPEYILDAVVEDGQSSKAGAIIEHCPTNSGCRTNLNNNDGTQFFQLADDFTLTFKQPNHSSVWLDYILIVPASKYNDRLITEEPIDKTGLYLNECGKNYFYMDDETVSDFCRSSVFSVTTAYNEGALPCKCSPAGSLSLECNHFGGQCQCKPFVIGRRCEECKPGFYGFPNCEPCNCPALCDEVTGDCMCPPRVVGPNCDRCENYTFGYHSIVGCEPCDCNPLGVENYNLQCDLFDGYCTCKPNVEGRKCDQCSNGYYAFPYCEQCDCDLRGTTNEICEQNTANCICKPNVDGQACDVCKEGTFNLQDKNPNGCTKCFCFGKSTRCSSSRLYRSLITGMKNWGFASINQTSTVEIEILEGTAVEVVGSDAVGIDLTEDKFVNKIIYFSAPSQYLGNQLKAYGGYLRYSLFCTTGPFAPHVSAVDIILHGGSTYLLHFSVELPAVATYYNATLEVSEDNFILPNGLPVNRERLMQVLQDLKGIYIKATYWENGVTTRLAGVSLDTASETPTGLASGAMSVEQCQCPPNYIGLSCEECAPGFYRAPTGPYGGFCIPCQCNGHAADCDKVTGVCIDCQNNTIGDHCEECAPGFNGDATIGRQDDCLICACPLPIKSNNFADKCDMSDDDALISCHCKPGYTGYRCQSCANGFYGNPEEIGDYCKPCECSGNIDPDQENSCDSVTGECKACLNNAFGPACELCKPWFYGDAVNLKNCQGCDCNTCGAVRCNHVTGLCDCKENILGEKCDRCAENHYGFSNCTGCLPCECEAASTSQQCEPYSGQCACKPGITGRTCNKCAPGHWNYTVDGCTKCECKELYSRNVDCDPVTGQCKCLPGVLGPKCDHCPDLTVLDPVRGCLPCDSCVHSLVKTTKELSNVLQPYLEDFSSANSSFYLNQRLNYIEKEVVNLNSSIFQLEFMKLDRDPLENEIEKLKGNVTNLQRTVKYDVEKAESAVSDKLISDVKELEKVVAEEVRNAKQAVTGIIEISNSLESGKGKFGLMKAEFEAAIKEAQDILERLKNRPPNKYNIKEDELPRAQECLANVVKLKERIDTEALLMTYLRDNITSLDNRIEDLKYQTEDIKKTVEQVNDLNTKNRNARVGEKYKELKNKEDISNATLTKARDYIWNTTLLLTNATSLSFELKKIRDNLEVLKQNSTERLMKYEDLDEIRAQVELASNKAKKMAQDVEADQLEAELTDINAVSGYKVIIDTVRDALLTANNASLSAESAFDLTEGLEGRAAELQNNSNGLYIQTRGDLEAIEELEEDLKRQTNLAKDINDLNVQTQADLADISNRIDKMVPTFLIPKLAALADESNEMGKKISNEIKDIVEEIPKNVNTSINLHKAMKDAENKYRLAQTQLDAANAVIDSDETQKISAELMDKLNYMNEHSNEVDSSLKDLKKHVERIREVVNGITFGIRFYRNSTLELRKPSSLPLDEINNYISLYFKTSAKNGLLLYLGNEKGHNARSKRDVSHEEYICLEIESGLPKLTVDLGSGPESIVNSHDVSNDQWYQAIIDRTGKLIKLTITWEEVRKEQIEQKMEIQRGRLTGNTTILNLDHDKSKLYVGGFPSTFSAPDQVTYNSFDGVIESLTIGDAKVAMWNYIENVNSRTPHRERDSLVIRTSPTGLRFDGEGYAVLSKQSYKMRERSAISIHFKTYAEEGLLFLAMKDDYFLSIEMRKGQILYQFSLGGGPTVAMASNRPKGYNDDKWHSLEAARDGRKGSLRVDGVRVSEGEATGPNTSLRGFDHLFIGGYPNGHSISGVTRRSFDGCIDNVQIGGTSVDLNENTEAFGVSPGCPEKVAKVMWLEKGSRGYAGLPASLDDSEMELVLRFKTDSPNGVLAYLGDESTSSILQLIDGQIDFQVHFSSGDHQRVTSRVPLQFNDSNWHVVMASHRLDSLRLFIDDYLSYESEGSPKPIRLLKGKLYFGGVPSSVDATAALLPHFSGCLGQATLNGQLISLANLTDVSDQVIIGKCYESTDINRIFDPPFDLPPGIVSLDTPPVETVTTTTTPKTPPAKLIYDSPECKLPLYPEPMSQKPKTVGYRFGTKYGSRLEYGLAKYNKNHFSFSVDINSRAEDGLLLYASDLNFADYIALFLKEGKINFRLRCNSEEKDLTSDKVKIDEWQTITVMRSKQRVSLKVDNVEVDSVSLTCEALSLNKPVYVGGMNPDTYEKAKVNSLNDVELIFNGCLKNFKMGEISAESPSKFGVIPCHINYEQGVYFSPDSGYVKQFEKFTVGSKMFIEMEIKARSLSGLLLSVHTPRKDYLVLELVNGSVRLATDNGQGEISTTFVPSDQSLFCDGNWHKIKAVKLKNVVTLAVDNKQGENGIGERKQLTADTRHPLYIGGRPVGKTMRGIKSESQFVGCIRSLFINEMLYDINVSNAFGNVTVGVCPTT